MISLSARGPLLPSIPLAPTLVRSDIRAVIRLAKDKAEAGKPQYEELLPAAARTVWNANSVSIERVMQQHNRQTAPGGTVVPIVAPAVFAALSKRHLDFTALKESVQQVCRGARACV